MIRAEALKKTAEVKAEWAAKRLRLMEIEESLEPCRLKKVIKEYDNALNDAIEGRRDINPWDMDDIDEVLRTGQLSERALRAERGRQAEQAARMGLITR